jgi:hypothetical protein
MQEKQNRLVVRSRAAWCRSMALPAGVGLIIFAGVLSGCNRSGAGGVGGVGGGDTVATVNGTAIGREICTRCLKQPAAKRLCANSCCANS